MLSPEDIAWADSCLTKDPDILDDPDISGSVWNSLKDALLETLNAEHDSSAYQKDDSLEEARMEILSSNEKTDEMQNLDKNSTDLPDNFKGSGSKSGDPLDHEDTDDFWLRHNADDIFLPTYNENLRDLGASDPEVDFVFQASELEQSSEDIFKVWELDVPPEDEEEDDLIKQLNRYLAESSLEPTNSVPDDSKVWKSLKDESLDDLISGVADLSLSPKSD